MNRVRDKAQARPYRCAVAVVLVVVSLLVVWEHTGGEHGHIGDVASVCMAVLGGSVAMLGLVGQMKRPTWPTLIQMPRPRKARPRGRPVPRSRAGPAELQVLLR